MGQTTCVSKKDTDQKYPINYLANEAIICHYLRVAKAEFKDRYDNPLQSEGEINDFQRIRTLGVGYFGRVMLAQHIESKDFYAIKILNKLHVKKKQLVKHVMNEKRILTCLDFPFTVSLAYYFKDNSNVYFVMDYVVGGELFSRIKKTCGLPEKTARFYASQVVLCFRYLHSLDIAHRDMKPENLLIAQDGYIKLTDFGYAKIIKGRTWTLCGTPEYLAPEIILSKGYNKSVDWWSFGILLFEMTTGYPPFHEATHMKLYEKIIAGHVQYPLNLSRELRNLLQNLIECDLTKRFGNLKNGSADITTHIWFKQVDWLQIYQKTIKAPDIPFIKGPGDDKYFDMYTEEPLNIAKTDECADEFEEF